MKTFNDYEGTEGIDKLMECVPYISEILSDEKTLTSMKDKTWLEVGGMIYKAHIEACDKLLKALGNTPESPISIVSSVAKVFSEIFTNRDMLDFFTSLPKPEKQTSVTENTEAAQ